MNASCARSFARSASLRVSRRKKLRTPDWWRRTSSSKAPRSSLATTRATSVVSLSLTSRLRGARGDTARDLARGEPSLEEAAEARQQEQEAPDAVAPLTAGADHGDCSDRDRPAKQRDAAADVAPPLVGQRQRRNLPRDQMAWHGFVGEHEPLDQQHSFACLTLLKVASRRDDPDDE